VRRADLLSSFPVILLTNKLANYNADENRTSLMEVKVITLKGAEKHKLRTLSNVNAKDAKLQISLSLSLSLSLYLSIYLSLYLSVHVHVCVCVCVCVQESVICVPVPLYHCFGMVIGSLQMAVWGSKCVFPSAGFDPGAALHAAQREQYESFHFATSLRPNRQ